MLDQPVALWAALSNRGLFYDGDQIQVRNPSFVVPYGEEPVVFGPSRSADFNQEARVRGILVSATATNLDGFRLTGDNTKIADTIMSWAGRDACVWPPIQQTCGGDWAAADQYVCDLKSKLHQLEYCTNDERRTSLVAIDSIERFLDEWNASDEDIGADRIILVDGLASSRVIRAVRLRPRGVREVSVVVPTGDDPPGMEAGWYWGRVIYRCFQSSVITRDVLSAGQHEIERVLQGVCDETTNGYYPRQLR
ncbi:MAG: hypothetical protein H6721_01135 [Sandaracinus sp.]|nr:hypothetical protein [Sandaracinus sp.]MCB9615984.1 hypothetical protein [Sandaracinus sp.]MCB9621855.1 hypothetical protein [Sandaracinus sp.]MCB9630748.1 hypothetical protein [Sandaracinus sp.]